MNTNITTTKELKQFCKHLQSCSYIAVDTEFLREKTYYPVLCLIQIAGNNKAACIDALADIDLSPLFEVLANPKILKVLHSCHQDIEIFYHLTGQVPTPVFDTQIGAMVCGLGENVSYHDLVESFLGEDIDKASRATDWTKRPLTEEQIQYALNDVVYLEKLYPKMQEMLTSTHRLDWVSEEMVALENQKLYYIDPAEAWLRVKPLSNRPKYLGVLQALCAWRERKAQTMNRPRQYILRDDVILQLASVAPENEADFARARNVQNLSSKWQKEIVSAIRHTLDAAQYPTWTRHKGVPAQMQGVQNILKLLLDVVCANEKVAPKLVATTDDLKQLVMDSNADIPALKGWRREIFGQKALDFLAGKIGIFFNPQTHQTEWIKLK